MTRPQGLGLSMTANKTATNPDTYTGQLPATRGPAFSTMPDPNQVTRTPVIGR
jgi:hypothetical protein